MAENNEIAEPLAPNKDNEEEKDEHNNEVYSSEASKRFGKILPDSFDNIYDVNGTSMLGNTDTLLNKTLSFSVKGHEVPLHIMEIDIGENKEPIKHADESISRDNVNLTTNQQNISTKFNVLIDKINFLGDELNSIENNYANNALDDQKARNDNICLQVDNVSFVEHCNVYETPKFVNLDELISVNERYTANDYIDGPPSESFNTSSQRRQRRRSLSVGSGGALLQRGESLDILNEESNGLEKKFLSKSCVDIALYKAAVSSNEDNTKTYSKPKKIAYLKKLNSLKRNERNSFIGKSISVDIYHEDEGYFSSKTRRNGLNFDSNSDDDAGDFSSDLRKLKENYKRKKKKTSTGLKFARSVENLLKLDKSNNSTEKRQRSNTDWHDTLPLQYVTKKNARNLKQRLFSKQDHKNVMIRETHILGEEDEYDNNSLNISVERAKKVASIIEMYVDQNGNVIRKIEIDKVTGQSLGFFIRFGDGIDKTDGIFISRVTLGSFADVNNLLHAGDEILQVNKVNVSGHTLEEFAKIVQISQSLIIKTRSALPLPIHAQPLIHKYQNIPILVTPSHNNNKKVPVNRTQSDPKIEMHKLHQHVSRERSNTVVADNRLLAEPKSDNKPQKSPTFYRKLLKDTKQSDEIQNASNFQRAQKYQLKPPTALDVDAATVVANKPNKSFIRSPKLFRKAIKKISLGDLSKATIPISATIDYSSSSSDTDDGTTTEFQIYESDKIDDVNKTRGISGNLTVSIQKILNVEVIENKDCYCTIELDGEFKASTKSNKITEAINFDESFELELRNSQTLSFNIFSQDFQKPRQQHELISEGRIQFENFVMEKNKKTTRRILLKTTTQLDIKLNINFIEAESFLKRSHSRKSSGIFGFNLSQTLVKEENTIPILVRKCVEEIEKRGLNFEGIYRISGNARKKRILRKQFEENSAGVDVSDETEVDCHMLAGILKDYLRELPNPLISQEMYLSLYDISKENSTEDRKTRILMTLMKKLPITNRSTLIYIMEHLQRVIERKEDNKMDSKNLAVCFGPTMMCPPISTVTADMFDFKKQIQALEFLLNIWPTKVTQNSV